MMTNITEDYVSFETAKLLKEKGFIANDRIYKAYRLKDKSLINSDGNFNYDIEIPAPTHQMAMKYLRTKGVIIVIGFSDGELGIDNPKYFKLNRFYWVIYPDCGIRNCSENYKTYEESVEEAIKYALTHKFFES